MPFISKYFSLENISGFLASCYGKLPHADAVQRSRRIYCEEPFDLNHAEITCAFAHVVHFRVALTLLCLKVCRLSPMGQSLCYEYESGGANSGSHFKKSCVRCTVIQNKRHGTRSGETASFFSNILLYSLAFLG